MKNWIRNAATPMIALAMLVAGCDEVGEPTRPGVTPLVYSTASGKQFVVAKESSPDGGMVSATIGSGGGKLTLGIHELEVARGAVSEATLFTMRRDETDPLRVKLTAGRTSENDVGAAGFAAPVTLVLSYSKTSDLPSDLSGLTVVYFRPDGLVEELSTAVDQNGKRASAGLLHFSDYGLAWPH